MTHLRDMVTLQQERLQMYELIRSQAQTQANLQQKSVNVYEVATGVFGFRFDEQRKGQGYITTLQPEK